MKSVSFSIRRVNRLRRAAERARAVPADDADLPQVGSPSDGWSASALRATELLRVFDVLWLKPGFALHACEFRAGSNGNGIIWAVPADAPLVAPDDCSRVEDAWLQPPRPPKAVPLMQALEGDGSPWSYLSASILSQRGGGIRGNLARLRLERPDDSLQAPAAGRRPGSVGRSAGQVRSGSEARRAERCPSGPLRHGWPLRPEGPTACMRSRPCGRDNW